MFVFIKKFIVCAIWYSQSNRFYFNFFCDWFSELVLIFVPKLNFVCLLQKLKQLGSLMCAILQCIIFLILEPFFLTGSIKVQKYPYTFYLPEKDLSNDQLWQRFKFGGNTIHLLIVEMKHELEGYKTQRLLRVHTRTHLITEYRIHIFSFF